MAAITNLDGYNKPNITVPTKQYKELRQSKEKLEQELEEKTKRIRGLLEKNAMLEKRGKQLEDQAKALEKRLKEALAREFLELQDRREEIGGCEPYERFFNRSAQSFQTLLGLPGAIGRLAEEKLGYYLWEVAASQLICDRKRFGGEIWEGRLVLPKAARPLGSQEEARKLVEEPLEEIERYIYEDKRKVWLGRIALQKKRAVQQMGALIGELERGSQGACGERKASHGFIKEVARRVGDILESNEIYPMFARDERLAGCGSLQDSFLPANGRSIAYPGLFVKWEGRYEILGANLGMDGDGEEAAHSRAPLEES